MQYGSNHWPICHGGRIFWQVSSVWRKYWFYSNFTIGSLCTFCHFMSSNGDQKWVICQCSLDYYYTCVFLISYGWAHILTARRRLFDPVWRICPWSTGSARTQTASGSRSGPALTAHCRFCSRCCRCEPPCPYRPIRTRWFHLTRCIL